MNSNETLTCSSLIMGIFSKHASIDFLISVINCGVSFSNIIFTGRQKYGACGAGFTHILLLSVSWIRKRTSPTRMMLRTSSVSSLLFRWYSSHLEPSNPHLKYIFNSSESKSIILLRKKYRSLSAVFWTSEFKSISIQSESYFKEDAGGRMVSLYRFSLYAEGNSFECLVIFWY